MCQFSCIAISIILRLQNYFRREIKRSNFRFTIHLSCYTFYLTHLQSDKIISEVSRQNYFMLHGHEIRLTRASSVLPYVTLRLRLLGTPRRAERLIWYRRYVSRACRMKEKEVATRNYR